MHRALYMGSALALLMGGTACKSHNESTEPGPTTELRAATSPANHLCPMSLPGTTARVIEVPGGVALELSTSDPSAIDELRRRARIMAQQGQLGMMAGPGGGVGAAGRRRSPEAAARARPVTTRVEDTPAGVRVMLVPQDPTQLDALRARAQVHITRMAGNTDCLRARTGS